MAVGLFDVWHYAGSGGSGFTGQALSLPALLGCLIGTASTARAFYTWIAGDLCWVGFKA